MLFVSSETGEWLHTWRARYSHWSRVSKGKGQLCLELGGALKSKLIHVPTILGHWSAEHLPSSLDSLTEENLLSTLKGENLLEVLCAGRLVGKNITFRHGHVSLGGSTNLAILRARCCKSATVQNWNYYDAVGSGTYKPLEGVEAVDGWTRCVFNIICASSDMIPISAYRISLSKLPEGNVNMLWQTHQFIKRIEMRNPTEPAKIWLA